MIDLSTSYTSQRLYLSFCKFNKSEKNKLLQNMHDHPQIEKLNCRKNKG